MKVLFWVPYPTEGPSNRYRVEQYLPELKKEGIVYTLHPFWSNSAFKVLYRKGYYFKKIYFFILGTISRFLDLLRIFKYDVVFIHREAFPIGPAFIERIFRLLKKPIIFDFDDAIFLPRSSEPNNYIEALKCPQKISKIIAISHYIIAGNRYLANYALRYNPEVTIIPTPIDTDRYDTNQQRYNRTDEVVIGWVGSNTTIKFLDPMKDVFIELTRRYPKLKFHIVGGRFYVEGLRNIILKDWSLEKELECLRDFDIGIMPMPNDDWTKGKCGFKAILYMSLGMPCVCSPVGVNTEIVQDGINGFLADSQEDWLEDLSALIEDPQLRDQMGVAGRKTVEEKYSLRANAPKFFDVLKRSTHY